MTCFIVLCFLLSIITIYYSKRSSLFLLLLAYCFTLALLSCYHSPISKQKTNQGDFIILISQECYSLKEDSQGFLFHCFHFFSHLWIMILEFLSG